MHKRSKIKQILQSKDIIGKNITTSGWIRTCKNQKTFSFIEINDGSSFSNFQAIADESLPEYRALLEKLTTGASVSISGEIVKSPGGKQQYEMKASKIELIGTCPSDFPLQKKRHSFEFLRSIAHLRPRTNTQGAVSRVRSALAYATHQFFPEEGF